MANDMAASMATMAGAVQSARMYGDIVSGTLNALNSPLYTGKGDAMSDTYDLSKSILSAAYSDKGAVMDYLCGSGPKDIVSGTLDALNSGSGNAMSDTYNFSKDILSAAYC